MEVNYYYTIKVNIEGYSHELSYYVLCSQEEYEVENVFLRSMLVEIIIVTVIMCLVALNSRAWSLGGQVI